MKIRILLASLAALSGTQAMATSLDDSAARSITVRFGDLNLSERAGVSTLLARINYAARVVCGDDQSLDLQRTDAYRGCVQRARDAALAQIEFPVR
jgi:UrcA family protein